MSSRRTKKTQSGGNPTPMPWHWYNGGAGLNTVGFAANNYGRMSAQGVNPTPVVPTVAQAGGGPFSGLYGSAGQATGVNQPTYNPINPSGSFDSLYGNLSTPGFYTKQSGGNCGCSGGQPPLMQEGGVEVFTRKDVISAVSDATGASKSQVKTTLSNLYGQRRSFNSNELNNVERSVKQNL
jgi:hypothetical protein